MIVKLKDNVNKLLTVKQEVRGMKMFSKKLMAALRNADISQSKFAEMMGITGASLSHYIKKKRTPPYEMIREMEDKLGMHVGYLMHDEIIAIDSVAKAPIFSCRQNVDKFLSSGNIPADTEFVYIFSNDEKEIKSMEKFFAIRVAGDAMASSDKNSLHDGDVVIIDPLGTVVNNSLVAACIKNEFKIRKYLTDGCDAFLQSNNEKLPIIKLSKSVTMYGVVVQVSRKI